MQGGEPLAPQKVSQTLLLPFVISLIASQSVPDTSFFFFFSPANNIFIMGYLHVCKCRTAACLQKFKQASPNKIVSVVQWQGRNLVCGSSLGSQQEQLRVLTTDACKWCGRCWCWFVLRTLRGIRETSAGMETRPRGTGAAAAEGPRSPRHSSESKTDCRAVTVILIHLLI